MLLQDVPQSKTNIGQSHRLAADANGSSHARASSSSPSTSPLHKSTTLPLVNQMSIRKRIIVCCDGTWQDGVIVDARWKYTNVLRLSRAIAHADPRTTPPTPQIVFYQSGIGSGPSYYSEIVDGGTGWTLGEKVQEAYAFIAQNYHPGDEIFLFGFSRGAFTARTIASFIGSIGVLDRREMDHFAEIFVALQKRGKEQDPQKQHELDAQLAPWTEPNAPGIKRLETASCGFSIKCVGVFDTVGSVGLPEEITLRSKKMTELFGFNNKDLGDHIENAFQALAINEYRADFDCAKWYQSDNGRKKGQVLKQCWFTGCHSDIGGGYKEHDLTDITLAWMVANVEGILKLDLSYIATLPEPLAPWGREKPHNSLVGIFELAKTIQRKFPTDTNLVTHETIHPSVLEQGELLREISDILKQNPDIVCKLMPLEQELKAKWTVTAPPDHNGHQSSPRVQSLGDISANGVGRGGVEKVLVKETGASWIEHASSETSWGAVFLKELTKV